MKRYKQYLRRRGIFWLMLLGGLYCIGSAIWNLSRTAMYVHEAVLLPGTVVDVRQSHFASQLEPLFHGNLSWTGDISYQPIVAFDMPGGIHIRHRNMPDLDNENYQLGQPVEVITLPHDPNQSHINKWKFLWGGDCLLLGFGLLIGLPAWLAIRHRPLKKPIRPPRQETIAPQPQPKPRPKLQKAEQLSPPHAATGTEGTPFQLVSSPPAPKKRRSPRKNKQMNAADWHDGLSPKLRKRKKSEPTQSSNDKPVKRNSPRKKKTKAST